MDKIVKFYKDILGTGNELADSVSLSLEDRLTSPFYGYFITSWVIINWRLIYIAFFVRGEDIYKKTGLISNEYLFLNVPTFGTWTWLFHFFIYPFLATIFIFWLMPFVTRPFFSKSIRNKKAMKLIELGESKEIKNEEKELVIAEKNLIKEAVDKAKQIKRASVEAPEVLWESEFLEFKKSKLFLKFPQLPKAIYENAGRVGWNQNRGVDTDLLSFADSSKLVSFDQENNKISFTDKGAYFNLLFSKDTYEPVKNVWKSLDNRDSNK